MTLVLNLSPSVIHDYLRDGIQVTKVGSFHSKTLQIIYGVPQGSILGAHCYLTLI